MAQSRHPDRVSECPLSGVKRTSRRIIAMSAYQQFPEVIAELVGLKVDVRL